MTQSCSGLVSGKSEITKRVRGYAWPLEPVLVVVDPPLLEQVGLQSCEQQQQKLKRQEKKLKKQHMEKSSEGSCTDVLST